MRTINSLHWIWFTRLCDAAVALRRDRNCDTLEDFARFCNPTPASMEPHPLDIDTWYAYWILQQGLPVYGCRPPSRVIRRIIEKVHLGSGAHVGWSTDIEYTEAKYDALFVRRWDLWRNRAEINPKDNPIFVTPFYGRKPKPKRFWVRTLLSYGLPTPKPPFKSSSPPHRVRRRIRGWGLTIRARVSKFTSKLV